MEAWVKRAAARLEEGFTRAGAAKIIDEEYRNSFARCESRLQTCGAVTNYDIDGVPLCEKCFGELKADVACHTPDCTCRACLLNTLLLRCLDEMSDMIGFLDSLGCPPSIDSDGCDKCQMRERISDLIAEAEKYDAMRLQIEIQEIIKRAEK